MADQSAHEVLIEVKYIPLSYDHAESDASALKLLYALYPQRQKDPGPVVIVPFTEGIMNTLLKITKMIPGRSQFENEKEAILLRAYGNGSEILVDRDMEATTHALLAQRGLAAPLLGRFKNGLLYKFIPGRTCTAQDIVKEPVWRAVAERLGQWHAQLPLPSLKSLEHHEKDESGQVAGKWNISSLAPSPSIWVVLQKWVSALPAGSGDEESVKALLQKELHRSFSELGQHPVNGNGNFVLGHCDLLTANIIVPEDDQIGLDYKSTPTIDSLKGRVSFIDYEYAVPCPAAFDLANHFSEWGGFECDYNMLPTKKVRRRFIDEYLQSYRKSAPAETSTCIPTAEELLVEVDRYRGLPGFYWSVQARIQAAISHVEFDWTAYADVRLAEYWAWRGEEDGTRAREGKEMTLREERWTQEA